jgi:hypothetical protein
MAGRNGGAYSGPSRAPAFSRAIGRQAERTGNGSARLFSAGASRLCIAKQNNRASPSSASLRPFGCRSVPLAVR